MQTISKLISLSLILLFFSSCSNDDAANSTQITLSDFTTSFDEFSENGTVIGTIAVNSNSSNIVFTISNENVPGALAINDTTGDLSVADATKFRYNDNQTITALVTASAGGSAETALVTINLNRVSHFMIDGNVYKMTQGFLEATSSSLGNGYRLQLYSNSVDLSNGVSGTGDLIYIRTEEQNNTLIYNVDEYATLINNNFDVVDGITPQTPTSGSFEMISEVYSSDFSTVDVELNFDFMNGTTSVSGYFNGTLVNND